MKRLFLAIALGGSASLIAQDLQIPLAVTGSAKPLAMSTPTTEDLRKSDDHLKDGLAFLKNMLPLRAVDEFNESVALAPRAENYKALGTAYYQAGNTHKAAWAYRQSLALKPDAKLQALLDSLAGQGHGAQSCGAARAATGSAEARP
jgi:Flp pilus assembly protein TadD